MADGIFLAAAVQIMDQNAAPCFRIADLVEIDPVLLELLLEEGSTARCSSASVSQ